MGREEKLEALRQASENARAFMDLRYKHFASYLVVAGAVLVASSQLGWRDGIPGASIGGIGLVLTLLWWRLETRSAQLHAAERVRVAELEELASIPRRRHPTPSGGFFSATRTTACIFAVASVVWIALSIAALV